MIQSSKRNSLPTICWILHKDPFDMLRKFLGWDAERKSDAVIRMTKNALVPLSKKPTDTPTEMPHKFRGWYVGRNGDHLHVWVAW